MGPEPPVHPASRKFLLVRLWSAYTSTDARRRRAFYHLFVAMAVFGLLWITKEEALDLPFLGTPVRLAVALALAPAFVFVLTMGYWYVCAHTLLAYIAYLTQYWAQYANKLSPLGYSFGRLHATFKQRDVTEQANPFLFPHQHSTEWDASISRPLVLAGSALANLCALASVVVPICVYWVNVVWLMAQVGGYAWPTGIKCLIAGYVLLGALLGLAPAYFYQRAKPARDVIRRMMGS